MNSVRKAVFVLLAGGIAVTGCGSSSRAAGHYDALTRASCKVSIHVPNVGIYSTNTYHINATWTRCGASDAWWNMMRGNEMFGLWSFPTNQPYEFYMPGYEPVGKFSATPAGAYDNKSNYLPQNTYTFYIKLNSRITFSTYRSGRNVFVRALVTRFNPNKNWGTGGWQNSVSRRVAFYDKIGGRWRWRGGRYTGRNGYTRYQRLAAPTRRPFRAIVRPTATLWGRNSNTDTR